MAAVLAQRLRILGRPHPRHGMGVVGRAVVGHRHAARRRLRHEYVASCHVRWPAESGCRRCRQVVAHLFRDPGRERAVGHPASLCADDLAAPLAGLGQQPHHRSLADQRPVLPAQSGAWRPRQSRISHRRRCAHRHRIAGRLRQRRRSRLPLRRDLHRRAVDDRRRARCVGRRTADPRARISGHRRAPLCGVGKRRDDVDRQPVCAGLGEQEPGRGGIPLCDHTPARER